jgi:hypothetical protein
MVSYIEQCEDYWVVKADEGYGNALVLRTAWTRRYLDLVRKYKIRVVRLNERLGWHDSDLSFLLEIPGIHGVDILSDKVVDVSPIFRLKNIKTLSLHCKAKVAGDFSELGQLQCVGLDWRDVYESVFGLDTLRSINILGYPDTDLTRWAANGALERLRLQSRKLENLDGITHFPNVRQVHLYRCRVLQSLDAIGSLISIHELRLSVCPRIRDLSPISHLSELRVLEIEDCQDIDSVVPIAKCRRLERLQIAGDTTILDGDLSNLVALPNLRTVLLARKKHYSHSAEELEKGQS